MKPLDITIRCNLVETFPSDPVNNYHRFQWKISIDGQQYGYQTISAIHPCLLFSDLEYMFDKAKYQMIEFIKEERKKYKEIK